MELAAQDAQHPPPAQVAGHLTGVDPGLVDTRLGIDRDPGSLADVLLRRTAT
jgi:hypothetical protein